MHLKRWITALIALPLLIIVIIKGGSTLFTLCVAVVCVLTLWEYFRIVYHNHSPSVPSVFPILAFLISVAMITMVQNHGFKAVTALITINIIGVAFLSILRFKLSQDAPVVAAKQVFGVVYIGLFLTFAVLLHAADDGIHWVLLILLVIAAGDTGAYYAGSYLGRHKLCPSVSPKKTIEGAIGGLLANLIIGIAYKMFFLPSLTLWGCALLVLVVGGVGQAGDLFESEFKRAADIKDSGTLLPGHGGFFDRIDALLFALPTAYLLKEYILL